MNKIILFTFICMLSYTNTAAQNDNIDNIEWQRVERDSLPAGLDSLLAAGQEPRPQPTDDKFRVVTNRFWHNWWITADVGMHTFRGDWSGNGKFSETLSPDFNIGVGKWFTPGMGVKGQFGMGSSRGFTEIWTPYAIGTRDNPMLKADGTEYWQLKTKWWEVNANVTFNLSRLFLAWENYGSNKRFNQFLLSLGIGAVHHYGNPQSNWSEVKGDSKGYGGPHNEWYGNAELQYSRFFSPAKTWSLDIKLRGRFYETHYDLSPIAGHRWDYHIGLNIGATYYIKNRGWDRSIHYDDINYFINIQKPAAAQDCPEYRILTFYIFYPNNYSGRNDAPVVADAAVHSMDYLAGGIFTQKKFKSNSSVASRLKSGTSLCTLKTEDIPTVKATFTENPTGVVRGYEMSNRPISLSMDGDDMIAFENITGYFYAPIYESDKTWGYRIDDETRSQVLLNSDNYMETTSYSLNAHAGLATVRANMPVDDDTSLYSFADVYAALTGDDGYIGHYSDKQAVDAINDILTNGTIVHVQAEGLATSQDNYTGNDAGAVGLSRNKALSHYRAYSAIKWLKESGKFDGLKPENFSINILPEPIGKVEEQNTRGLKAKLNRCARIKIMYVK